MSFTGHYPPNLYMSILKFQFSMFSLGNSETRPRICNLVLQFGFDTLTSLQAVAVTAEREKKMTYSIAIKLTDDTLVTTRLRGMDWDTAQELLEKCWLGMTPRDQWAGLALVDSNGDIDNEMEW